MKLFRLSNAPQCLDENPIKEDIQTVYAVGDIHGELDLLKRLEQSIFDQNQSKESPAILLMLGDYVDRGPQSAQVIEHLMVPLSNGFQRICLMGNHELMMAEFVENPNPQSKWLTFGGRQTLVSYGISIECTASQRLQYRVKTTIPAAHLEFIKGLAPYYFWRDFVFVHAGLNLQKPLNDQTTTDTCWTQPNYAEQKAKFGRKIVHGHYIVKDAFESEEEISLDTGAYATGRLSYAKITRESEVEIHTITL